MLILDERDGLGGTIHELSSQNNIVFKEDVLDPLVDMNLIEWLKCLWTQVEEEAESHDNRRTHRFFRRRNVEFQAVKVTFECRGSVEYPVVL